jgi:hypothetical protein
MPPIDYTIPGQIKGVQIESPMNAMMEFAQLQGLQQQQQMNALKFEEAQREAQERNALAKLDPSSPGYLTQLKRVNPKLALEYQKAGLEAESADITRQKNKSDLFQAKLKDSRYFLEGFDVNSPTAPDDYIAWAESNINDPVLGPVLAQRGVTLDKVRQNVAEAIRTGTFEDLVNQSRLGVDRFTELTPAFKKAEREQIDQEHSDFLNTRGNPPLTKLQFIEFRKRQRGTAAAPNAAAPAPAPAAAVDATAPAPAPAAAVDLTNVPLADRSVMFNRPPVNQLGGGQITPAAVNNLGFAPAAITAADRTAPTPTAPSAVTTERPAIHPDAARLMNSTLKSDQDKAAIIQRNYENDAKQTEKQRDFAAAKDAGFKGDFPQWLDQQRETESEREYRRAKQDGSFKGTFLDFKREMAKATKIVVQPASGAKPTDTTLDFIAQQYIQDSSTITAVPRALRMAVMNRAAELMGGSAKDMAGDVIANRQDTAAAKAAVKDFTSGRSAVATRSFNTAIDHLETMEKLATALQNNDTRLFNSVGNFFAKQTGTAAPANFEAAKAIVGGEVAKALTGANMALKDREEIRDAIIASSSPEQLRGVLKTFKQLLGGQLNSLNIQYQTSTGRDDFRNKLSPASKRELDALNPQAPARSSSARQTPAPPAVGEIRAGHKFKGGNPADKNNWEKVK